MVREIRSQTQMLALLALAVLCASGWCAAAQNTSQLTDQFQSLYAAGKYPEAERLAKRTLDSVERSGNPSAIATWLHNLAMSYDAQSRYAEAAAMYRRSLGMLEKALGPEHPNVALSMSNLANTEANLGHYAEAESLHRRALALREKANGADHPALLQDLIGLAGVYHHQGRFGEVEPIYQRALRIVEKAVGPENAVVAAILGNLAAAHQAQGRYPEAEVLHKRTLAMREKVQGADHPDVTAALNNLATLYIELGRYAEAEPLEKRALALSTKTLGPDHRDTGSTLVNLAGIYQAQSRYAEAEPLYRQALTVLRKSLGAEHPTIAVVLTSLGDIAFVQDRRGDAQRLYEEALAIQQKALGDKHPDIAKSMVNLARARSKDDPAESERLLERAGEMFQETLGPNHPLVAVTLHYLAIVYWEQDRDREAEETIERVLTLAERDSTAPENRVNSYRVRSEILWKMGRPEEAMENLARAMQMIERQRARSSGTEHERAAAFSSFAEVFERMATWQIERENIAEAFAAAERRRARALVEQMELRGVDLLAGLPENEAGALRRREAESRERLTTLQNRLKLRDDSPADAAADAAVRQQLESEIGRAREQYLDTYREVRDRSPAYRMAVGKDYKPVALATLAQWAVQQHAIVLEYLVGEDAAYLFVIPPDGSPRVHALSVSEEQAAALGVPSGALTAARLHEVVTGAKTGVMRLLSQPQPDRETIGRLAALSDVLLPEDERAAVTGGTAEHLAIVPDGALALVPFEALVIEPGTEPRYLLDAAPPIVYAPSATVLYNLAGRQNGAAASREPVLAVGDPAYGTAPPRPPGSGSALAQLTVRSRYGELGGRFTALPFSGTEANWVADVFQKQGVGVSTLFGANATEANVRAGCRARKIVHLACHGLADERWGNFFGALALAPGRTGDAADDGFLTSNEIQQLDLRGCELAILSACETNYGPEQRGEGVWGLSRGFLVAGARRVVASNWLVDDEAAASLVSYFAGGVAPAEKEGRTADYAAALHAAKRWVRQQDKWQAPYYWATFVLVGPP